MFLGHQENQERRGLRMEPGYCWSYLSIRINHLQHFSSIDGPS